jgi:hypothetical protein
MDNCNSNNNGYWTDASSLDAISTCSDSEQDVVNKPSASSMMNKTPTANNVFSPTLSLYSLASASIASTPINVSSAHQVFLFPQFAYLVGKDSVSSALLQALKVSNQRSEEVYDFFVDDTAIFMNLINCLVFRN